jgi:hypothetical protein
LIFFGATLGVTPLSTKEKAAILDRGFFVTLALRYFLLSAFM